MPPREARAGDSRRRPVEWLVLAALLLLARAGASAWEQAHPPEAIGDRTREMGRNAPVVDSLQRAFGVSSFPTLVLYMPATGEHMTQRGFPSAEETMQWLSDGGSTLRLRAIAPAAPAKP